MHCLFASLAVLGVLGCASAPAKRFEIGPAPDREPSRALATPRPAAESTTSAGFVLSDDAIPAEHPAAREDADPYGLADANAPANDAPPQGNYPPPQGAPPPPGYPPPQGTYPPPQVVYVAPAPPPFHRSRFTLKGGYYSVEDTDHLDDGYIIQGSWLNFFSPNFGTELELGYLEADGKTAGIDTDLWGIPFMFNARLSLPVKMLELYGGAGIGSIFYSFSLDPGSDHDGWVAAADTFLGATLTLKSGVVLGIEGKYYFTESVHSLDGGLDAYAAMLTLGFAR